LAFQFKTLILLADEKWRRTGGEPRPSGTQARPRSGREGPADRL